MIALQCYFWNHVTELLVPVYTMQNIVLVSCYESDKETMM